MDIYVCEILKGKFVEGQFVEGKQYVFDCYERASFIKVNKTYKESPLLGNVNAFINENCVDYNLSAEGVFIAKKYDKGPGGKVMEYWEHVVDGQGIIYTNAITAKGNGDKNYKATKISEGKYVDGELIDGKVYLGLENDNKLRYEGTFKDGKYSGKGKLYDFLGKLKFEGEFENGDIKK